MWSLLFGLLAALFKPVLEVFAQTFMDRAAGPEVGKVEDHHGTLTAPEPDVDDLLRRGRNSGLLR